MWSAVGVICTVLYCSTRANGPQQEQRVTTVHSDEGWYVTEMKRKATARTADKARAARAEAAREQPEPEPDWRKEDPPNDFRDLARSTSVRHEPQGPGPSTSTDQLPRGDYQTIQRSVLPAAHKGNCIAANIARQTMYALGQDMMLDQLFEEEARCAGPLSSDEQESLAEVERKAESADPFYLVVRGILRLEGRGMPVDQEGAVEDVQLAARRGSALAKYDLGKFYSQGTVVEQDRARALSLYQEAATGGIPGAWYNVGCMHNEAQAGPRDVPAAMRAWEKGAQMGHAWSQYNLGLFYSLGEDVPQDRVKAAHWLKKAGKQGHTGALDHLLVFYREESSDLIATAELSEEGKACREGCFKKASDCRKGCDNAECHTDCRDGLTSCLNACD